MISEKKDILRPILESGQGTHLTIYLKKSESSEDLKLKLSEAISEANKWLEPIMTEEEAKQFTKPIENLLRESSILKNMKENVGLFRTSDSFRLLNIPISVQSSCIVATSFHIKPLLRWMQLDRDFLILGFRGNTAILYIGDQYSFQKIDTITFSEFVNKEQILETLNQWIFMLTKKHAPPLLLVGAKSKLLEISKKIKYENFIKKDYNIALNGQNLNKVLQDIRLIFKNDADQILAKSLLEFRVAEEVNLAKKNIFQIAKAAVQGKVSKLIIAESINVFGKIDKITGGLAIHPFDLDHEDDDLLDDIAQEVLSHGGKVVVARHEEMPKGRPILAILEGMQDLENKLPTNKYFEFSSNP
jgi:hypothetical protein